MSHQIIGDVPAELSVAGEARKRAQSEPLIRLRKLVCNAERKGRVGVEREMIEMVVVDDDDLIGPRVRKPSLDTGCRPSNQTFQRGSKRPVMPLSYS